MKLFVFDFDSTLMDGETIEYLAQELGIREQVAEITASAMAGELDFFESLTTRVALLKGLCDKRVDDICQSLPLMNGAYELIRELKHRGALTVCFSGGFVNATNYHCTKLGIDACFANILHSKKGVLSGKVGGDMMFNDSKGMMLQKLQALLNITQENTYTVGDGANDLSMFKYSKNRIAFCAKPIVKTNADIIIDEKDLTQILKYISL